ncbi:MAG TPA: hypothetical protein ENG69_00445 [Candidatus Korarchaeota archaeon]|nr:hypothetical protein [Candidatus Korarchaeota archaeon]
MRDRRRFSVLRLASDAAVNLGPVKGDDPERLYSIAEAVVQGKESPENFSGRDRIFAEMCRAYASGWSELVRFTEERIDKLDDGLLTGLLLMLTDLAVRTPKEKVIEDARVWLEGVEVDKRIAATKVLTIIGRDSPNEAISLLQETLNKDPIKRVRLSALRGLWSIAESRRDIRERVISLITSRLGIERSAEVRAEILSAVLSLMKD